MSDPHLDRFRGTTLLGGVLGVLCCSPVLVPAILGAGGLAAVWFSEVRVLALALLAAIALFGVLVYRDRQRRHAAGHSASSASEPGGINGCCSAISYKEREMPP